MSKEKLVYQPPLIESGSTIAMIDEEHEALIVFNVLLSPKRLRLLKKYIELILPESLQQSVTCAIKGCNNKSAFGGLCDEHQL